MGIKAATGIAGLTSKRLATLVQAEAPGQAPADRVAAVVSAHPMFLPRTYVDLHVVVDEAGLRVAIGADSPALSDDDGLTWTSLLVGPGGDRILAAAVQCVEPTASLARTEPGPGEAAVWRVRIDPAAEPAGQPDEVTLAEFSTGALFSFERRA